MEQSESARLDDTAAGQGRTLPYIVRYEILGLRIYGAGSRTRQSEWWALGIVPRARGSLMRTRARVFRLSFRAVDRLAPKLAGVHSSFWLRLLAPEDLESITVWSYREASGSGFEGADHNLDNIWPWEDEAFARLFDGRRNILVAAAGGGREMIRLARMGHRVTGFDPTPDLVRACSRHMEQAGLSGTILPAPPTQVPTLTDVFDGLVIGRGSYHHIPTRTRRIEFLRQLRDRMHPGSPIFIGDIHSREVSEGMPRRRSADFVGVCYFHRFTNEEIGEELAAAGFCRVEVVPSGFPNLVYVLAAADRHTPDPRGQAHPPPRPVSRLSISRTAGIGSAAQK